MSKRTPGLARDQHRIAGNDREARNRHAGGVLWFTGLSGSGKSTLAFGLEEILFRKGYHVYVLDGDEMRRSLNADLRFSPADRTENIRRVGEVAALFADAGLVCIASLISPYRKDRATARATVGDGFHEVFIRADLATCERRDPKGLYKKARAGTIQDFTAIGDRYEPPPAPSLIVDTANSTVAQSLEQLTAYVLDHFQGTNGRQP